MSKENKTSSKQQNGNDFLAGVSGSASNLTQCMAGRDGECWHPKCPVTMEDAINGIYCTLPLFDYRQ